MESGHEPPTIPMVTCPKGPQSKGIIVIMTSDPDSKNRKKNTGLYLKTIEKKREGRTLTSSSTEELALSVRTLPEN